MANVNNVFRTEKVDHSSGVIDGSLLTSNVTEVTLPIGAKQIVYAKFVTVEGTPVTKEYFSSDTIPAVIEITATDNTPMPNINYYVQYVRGNGVTLVVKEI